VCRIGWCRRKGSFGILRRKSSSMLLVGLKRILTVGLRWMVDLPKVWGHGGDVEDGDWWMGF